MSVEPLARFWCSQCLYKETTQTETSNACEQPSPPTLIEGHYPDPPLHAAITNLSACCSLAAATAAAHSHPALITTISLNIY